MRPRYSVGSATGGPTEVESLGNVSTGVVADLQAVMPVLSRISTAYLAYERCMPESRGLPRCQGSSGGCRCLSWRTQSGGRR
jgi:hypothetical protein